MSSAAVAEEIRCILIPLDRQALLLPNAAVAEIVDFHRLVSLQGLPDWVAGVTDWRQRRLPVVRFERLLGEPEARSQRRRIVVCHALDPQAKRPFIGLVSSAIPRLLRVHAGLLEGRPLAEDWRELPLHAALTVDGREALIPDLPALAQRLSEVDLG
ncbi:MAG TPA: chemotaxis protein CheW [Gammaproteobacteria bacterium]|nr:chemotaxis protein CheW [Gammaproteobacteria bacterium]